MSSILFIFALSLLTTRAWDYKHPEAWSDEYAECGASEQSPIDIPISDTATCSSVLSLDWTTESTHFAVTNIGKSLVVVPFDISHAGGMSIAHLEVLYHTNDTNIRLSNPFYNTYTSAVNKEYCLDSMHFHWSLDDEEGSEHTVNGTSYPLELHFVHYSCDYHVIGDAVSAYANGELSHLDDDFVLSVVGVMFEIGEANPILDRILSDSILDGVRHYNPNSFQELIQLYYTEFDPIDLLPENKEFVAYKGSLTTPPCLETVRWNVLKHTVTVSAEQMSKFRELSKSTNPNDTSAPNWRPPQDLGSRTIYECADAIELETVEKYTKNVIYDSGKGWDYKDTDWETNYPECGGQQQSPIDIPLKKLSQCEEEALELQWTSESVVFGVQNTGYSLKAIPFSVSKNDGADVNRIEILHHSNDTNIRLVNSFYDTYRSPVNKEYCFDSLHFHWGKTNRNGSEHAMNGKYSPLEVHLVHFSCDYSVAGAAIDAYVNDDVSQYDDPHVLAVIGVLFEIGEPNEALDKLLSDKVMTAIKKYDPDMKNDMLQLIYTEFDPASLLPESREFVAYKGSLTTPPCLQTVRWHVMKEKMTVSEAQMEKLRLFQTKGHSMAPNWRPLMNIAGRRVYSCAEQVESESVGKEEIVVKKGIIIAGTKRTWFFVSIVLIGLVVLCSLVIAFLGVACGNKTTDNHKKASVHEVHDEEQEDDGVFSVSYLRTSVVDADPDDEAIRRI